VAVEQIDPAPNGPGDPVHLELVLEPGAEVRGRLLAESGAPLAGTVAWRHLASGLTGSVPTDGDGAFAVGGLPAGDDVDLWGAGGRYEPVRTRAGDSTVIVRFVDEDIATAPKKRAGE
jgi:hypothetical protein